MIILMVAAVASLGLGHYVDAGAIIGVVVIVALIGFIQEGKAEQALESIRNNMLSPGQCGTRRRTPQHSRGRAGTRRHCHGGEWRPGSRGSAPYPGHPFPHTGSGADRGVHPVDKTSNETASDAVLAERTSMAFASTIVVQGTALGLVVETASNTEIGRISEMLRGVEQLRTPLLQQLDRAGRVLAAFILAAATITAVFGTIVHNQPPSEMFMAAVGLAVAAIPEGLPAIVTIGLALGVQAMARRNAIIRRLPAVETLGSISTIFSDKTGTLTRNEMTVRALFLPNGEYEVTGTGFAPEGRFELTDTQQPVDPGEHPTLLHFLKVGVLCNDSELAHEDEHWRIHGDPTEGRWLWLAPRRGSTRARCGVITNARTRSRLNPSASTWRRCTRSMASRGCWSRGTGPAAGNVP